MPRALLEAMVTGKPSGATPIGDIPEAIGNAFNGIHVEPSHDRKKDSLPVPKS